MVDVDYNTAYHVSTRQTPPNQKKAKHTSMTMYAISKKIVTRCLVRYAVTDAYYTKLLITHVLLDSGFHQIGKRRCDANLRYLYTGEQNPKGRPRVYEGKVIILLEIKFLLVWLVWLS